MAKFLKPWLVVLVMSIGAVTLRGLDPDIIVSLRLFAFDTYQRIAPRIYNPQVPVRIVDIDAQSLKRFGQWPWPRTRMAELVTKLQKAGAVVVGFDLVFAEPDRTSPEQWLASLPEDLASDPALSAVAARIAGRPANDAKFGAALARGASVLGVILNHAGGGKLAPKASFAHSGDDPKLFVPRFTGLDRNLSEIEIGAAGIGVLNWVPDADQIFRRLPILTQLNDVLFPNLTIEMMRVAQGASTYLTKSSGASGEEAFGAQTGIVAVRVGNVIVPTTASGEMWLRFAGTQPRRFLPAWKILEDKIDPEEIAGKLILVGTSAPGLFDLRATPLEAVVPGVEIHAEALEQMLTGDFLIRPDFAPAAEMAYILGLGLILAILLGYLGPQWTGLAALVLIVAVNAVSWFAFTGKGWLIDPVTPTIMGAAIYLVGSLVSYLRTRAERDQVREAFSHYLAPTVVEELARDPSRLKLGGEEREITILFLDIRGFTSISETMNATELTGFLNRFLTPMTEEILKSGGTIDKYMGDAIMAFWNAPLETGDHAQRSCATARAMIGQVDRLNQESARGMVKSPELRIGIGINTGVACVGNLGSSQRFAYSAIGDNVNIAARLEGQTKTYGTDIIVGEATMLSAPTDAFFELDLLKVKGRGEAVRIYALLGDAALAHNVGFAEL
ncbi:MAG: CHASE2 domain-containing protein, partial [Alphaproteobacteria bacterium]